MRRRVLTTTKILAIAFTSAACTKSEVRPDPGALPQSVTPSSTQATVVAQDASTDPKLLALQAELMGMPRAKVLESVAHFRPLCDKDGYPLVGNLNQKSQFPGMEVSELCAEVRKKPGS